MAPLLETLVTLRASAWMRSGVVNAPHCLPADLPLMARPSKALALDCGRVSLGSPLGPLNLNGRAGIASASPLQSEKNG
jgi:hypothetical protein